MLARKKDVDHSVEIATVEFEELNPSRLHVWSLFPDQLEDGQGAWAVGLGDSTVAYGVTYEEAWRRADEYVVHDYLREALA